MQEDIDETNPLCLKFENAKVRAFLNNGKVLIGKVNFIKNLVYIIDEHGQDALMNMSYIVAISRYKNTKK